jgi:hypothetical protein
MRHFREVLIGCGNRLRIPLYLRPARLCSSFGTWFAARLPSWFGWTLPCGAFETIADGPRCDLFGDRGQRLTRGPRRCFAMLRQRNILIISSGSIDGRPIVL